MRRKLGAVAVLVCFLASGLAQEEEKDKKNPGDFKVFWKDGLRLETVDETIQLRAGGRIQNDWAFFDGNAALEERLGELEDGTEIRRARLEASGVFYRHVEFKIQYDFATGDAAARDVYVGLQDIPYIGYFRVGHFKEPFSLEELTSSKYITFLERSLPNAFSPSRNTGFGIGNDFAQERMTWALGVFRDTDDFGFGTDDENYHVTGRLTGLPWYEEDGERLVHLGIAYSRRDPDQDQVRFRERPEAHLGPRFVDTGTFAANSVDLLGLEAAIVVGPFSVQSEYILSQADVPVDADPDLHGFYVYGSFFLTGEHRNYKQSDAAFDRLKPKRNFLVESEGAGAWEIALRYSRLDLSDGSVSGGQLSDFTAALNWYLNPYARVLWNYVFAELESGGEANIFQMRFQVDF